MKALPVDNDRYIKTKIRTYGDKAYTSFRGLNVPEDDGGCDSFAIIFIDSVLAYKIKIYEDNCIFRQLRI